MSDINEAIEHIQYQIFAARSDELVESNTAIVGIDEAETLIAAVKAGQAEREKLVEKCMVIIRHAVISSQGNYWEDSTENMVIEKLTALLTDQPQGGDKC